MNNTSATPSLPLDDIILPTAIGWWPLAPGWWVLLIALIALFVAGILGYRELRRRAAIRQQVFALLDEARDMQQQQPQADRYCRDINAALKRYWRIYNVDDRILNYYGHDWVDLLNAQAPAPLFTGSTALALAEGVYNPKADINVDELYDLAKRWIQKVSVTRLKTPNFNTSADIPNGQNKDTSHA
ncbi:MAG: DUF4381 domain-containing protein [Oleibacter sp.]|nr:DUF4381 domain-containing protein [Thalassolituus sp.]